jgi:hypothetical protein
MPTPSLCLDARLRPFVEAFRACWSQPQKRQVVTVLLGLLRCQGPHTLTGDLNSDNLTIAVRQIVDHSLVQRLYVLLGRHHPLAPWLYQQQAVCATEGVLLVSKIDPHGPGPLRSRGEAHRSAGELRY